MIVAVLQARMTSTRLPGKVLRSLFDRPMIGRQLDRIRRSARLDHIVVATSDETSDDLIAEFCRAESTPCFRGSLADVLHRINHAAQIFGPPNHVVRLTADCPLADWSIIDACTDLHLASGADYTSNAVVRSFPDGLDVEIMRASSLQTACRDAVASHDREHVTPFIYGRPDQFRIQALVQEPNLEQLRWTVDTPADFDFIENIYREQIARGEEFRQQDILDFLKIDTHPKIHRRSLLL
jgi:spore coat polysaccharide biosynthesis protein SpsF